MSRLIFYLTPAVVETIFYAKHEHTHPHRMKTATPPTRVKPKPRKRAENKERTRRAILAAALEIFRRRGFHHATTKAISRRAGIAEGTLFNYFETKEDLALFFFERELTEVIEWYEQNLRLQKARLPEKLFAIIHRCLERIAPYEDFVGAVYLRALQPASKLSPLSLRAQAHNLRYLRFVREVLDAARRDGEIPDLGDLGAYAFGIFHLAVVTYWLQDRSAGKEQTLALLDRCLKLGAHLLRKESWQW